jgi:hypothetical protein
MKKICLLALTTLTMWNMKAAAQTAVYEYTPDTAIYEGTLRALFCPAPSALGITKFDDPNVGSTVSDFAGAVALFAEKKKNSNQYDIFSFTGKIASVTIPMDPNIFGWIFFSQFFINNDADWECIFNYSNDTTLLFKVFNANGTALLSDTGRVIYGYDWQNTYVVRMPQMANFGKKNGLKAWRFRTDVSSSLPNGLAKSAGAFPHAMMTFGPAGDYQIKLAPGSGGKTSVTLTDMLGRRIFSRNVGNVTSPMTFTVPGIEVPPSPFVTKVQDERGTVRKKEIPKR